MTTLNVKEKKESGKRYAKEVRNQGDVPAVIYGQKKDPLSISLNPVDYIKLLNGSEFKKNVILELVTDNNQTERVITKEIKVNPINNQILFILTF